MPDDRLEREINEILGNIEQFPSPENRKARARKRALRRLVGAIGNAERAVARQISRVSISQLMLVSFLMIIGSFFLRRFSPALMQWVLLAGVVLFISSFTILVFTRGGSSRTGYWRGRDISERSPSFAARLRRWLSSRRRNRP